MCVSDDWVSVSVLAFLKYRENKNNSHSSMHACRSIQYMNKFLKKIRHARRPSSVNCGIITIEFNWCRCERVVFLSVYFVLGIFFYCCYFVVGFDFDWLVKQFDVWIFSTCIAYILKSCHFFSRCHVFWDSSVWDFVQFYSQLSIYLSFYLTMATIFFSIGLKVSQWEKQRKKC